MTPRPGDPSRDRRPDRRSNGQGDGKRGRNIPDRRLFAPTQAADLAERGIAQIDVLLVSGDAYVDHPAFGTALIARSLEAAGFTVGVIAQPRFDDATDVARLGRPRLFAGVAAGAVDSMLAHYTAFRKKRSDDAYTPGGKAGARPNRASIIYTNLLKRAFPGLFVVLGGVEASLRRISHYDFWTEAIRRSILLDAKADLLLYGMAEGSVRALAGALDAAERSGTPFSALDFLDLPGAVFPAKGDVLARLADAKGLDEPLDLSSLEAIKADPAELVRATLALERQVHAGRFGLHRSGDRTLVLTPPKPETPAELDAIHALPFTRLAHPDYAEPVPALNVVGNSIIATRGCGGGCAFCGIALHQGRRVRSRSRASIIGEAKRLARHAQFAGTIDDVGGPTANLYGAVCTLPDDRDCGRESCLHPAVCPLLKADQAGYVDLLRSLKAVDGVRHVFVASGVRTDLGLTDPKSLAALVGEFTGGRLKIAPEHLDSATLSAMRKPGRDHFFDVVEFFRKHSQKAGKEQYLIPYFMSAHPGETEAGMRDLRDELDRRGWKPQQVQCFVPLPGTLSAAMHHAGVDAQGRKIPTTTSDRDRLIRHGLLAPRPDGPPERPQRPSGFAKTATGQSPRKENDAKRGNPKRPR